MKIAIDIDGTLAKTFERYGEEAQKRGYDTSGQKPSSDESEVSILFPNAPVDDIIAMYENNWKDMRTNYELYPGADIIPHLLEYELIGLTNRRIFEDTDHCTATQEWLRKHDIPLKKVIHTSNKALACQEHEFVVLIEDAVHNARAVAQAGVHVLLHDQPYNQHVEHENITRFTHWIEVPQLLRRATKRGDSGQLVTSD